MKLKQALVLGLTTVVLAVPAFATEEAINASSSANADQKKSAPAKAYKHKHCTSRDSAEAKNMDTDLKTSIPATPIEPATKN